MSSGADGALPSGESAGNETFSGIPEYFGRDGARLFGWYHAPHGPRVRDCALVLCVPLNHEATGVHRAFRLWAQAMAAAGIATIRFDYHGTGDSSGDESDANRVEAWIESVDSAADFVRARSGASHVALAGLQLGAGLALESATRRGDVGALILWAAMPTGKAFLREGRAFSRFAGFESADEETLGAPNGEQIGGLTITAQTVADLTALDPLGTGKSLRARVLVIPRDGGANDSAFTNQLVQAGATVERKVIDDFASLWADAHRAIVPAAVIRKSTEWLAALFPDTSAATPAMRPAYAANEHSDIKQLALTAPNALNSAIIERPVLFGDDARLFGIHSAPQRDPSRRTGVLLLNFGSVSRVGPNRWLTLMARRWSALGYRVLRMDFGGLGDSTVGPGGVDNHPFSPNANSDISAGIAELRRQGVERIVIAGGCSGAHASFHAGLALDGIDGVIMINPIVFYWKATDSLDPADWAHYTEARYYNKAARDPEAWKRVLLGKVNLLYVAGIVVNRIAEIVRAKSAAVIDRLTGAADNKPDDFPRDVRRVIQRGTRVMMLFSVGDAGHDFLKLYHARGMHALERSPDFALRLIDDADHTFTLPDARNRAESVLTEHLLAHYR